LDLNYRVKAVKYTAFRSGLYNVVIGQRTDTLQDKLKSCPDFEGTNQDGIALLRIIKVILYSFEQACHQEDELMMIKTMFYTYKQGNNMSLQRYYELFLQFLMKSASAFLMRLPQSLLHERVTVSNQT